MTTEQINNVIVFLSRADLKGHEAQAWIEVVQALVRMRDADPEPSVDPVE